MKELRDQYASYSMSELIEECVLLKEQNKTLLMRLAAVKTIVTSINPACSEKIKKLLHECGDCEVNNVSR